MDGFPEFKVALLRRPLPGLESAFSPNYTLAGKKVFAYVYNKGMRLEEILGTVIHERFHVFQGELPVAGISGTFTQEGTRWVSLLPSDIVPENIALAYLEHRALAGALLSSERNEDPIRDFISVRQERWRLFGSSWTAFENAFERSEGMAEYVNVKVLDKLQQVPLETPSQEMDVANKLLMQQDLDRMIQDMLHGRFYRTGTILGYLLDRHAKDWKKMVADGQAPFAVLASRFPVSDGERVDRLRRVKKEGAYDVLLSRLKLGLEVAREAMAQAVNDFEAWRGFRIIVRAKYTSDTQMSYVADVQVQLDERTSIYPESPSFKFKNAAVHLLIKNATLKASHDGQGIHTFEILLPQKPKISLEGKEVAGEGVKALRGLSVETLNLTLKAKNAKVQMDDKAVSVEIP